MKSVYIDFIQHNFVFYFSEQPPSCENKGNQSTANQTFRRTNRTIKSNKIPSYKANVWTAKCSRNTWIS